jgi:glycosyltransferase involved in cell wall biosynthesis
MQNNLTRDVLFIVHSLAESNGTERAVVNVANNLVEQECNVTILSLQTQGSECHFYINPNVNIKSLELMSHSKLIIYIRALFLLVRHIRKFNYSHVIGSLVYINITLSATKWLYNAGLIVCEHVPYEHPNVIVRIIRRFFYRQAQAVICLNKTEYNKFNRIFKSVIVAPNIIEDSPIQSKLNNNKILCVSRMSHEKGIDILLDVLKVFYSKKSNRIYMMDIVGDGPLLSELKSKSVLLGLEPWVSFCGKISNIFDSYVNSDLLLVTSRYEGFGLVIAEAMSCSVPVIAFDVESGPRHIINSEENGVLIKPFEIEDFAAEMTLILNDKDKLRKLSVSAKKSSTQFNGSNVISIWLEIIK